MGKPREETDFAQAVTAAILLRRWNNPITGHALAQEFGCDIRKITTIVLNARKSKTKIASSKGCRDKYLGVTVARGYYQALTPEEMASTRDMICRTAYGLLRLAKDLMDFGQAEPSRYEQELPGADLLTDLEEEEIYDMENHP